MTMLANFFATDTGQFMADLFLLLGSLNIFLPSFMLGRKIKGHRAKIHPAMTADDPLHRQIKQLEFAQRTIIALGILLILAGVYGMTRMKVS